jgi:serine/threonine-protein phosphatase 2A regulatory subunit A
MSSVLPSPSIQMARSLANLPVSDVSNLTPFGLFQRQLESGSTEAAVDAMKRLGVVAIMAGPTDTVTMILPYLTATVQQQSLSDELLLILGQQLLQVMKVVADPTTGPEFLPLLERLATTEETVVRDQAVVVLNALCLRCVGVDATTAATTTTAAATEASSDAPPPPSPPDVAATMIPIWMAVVKRLAGADWFTAKVSCAGIIPSLLQLCAASSSPAIQFELLSIYKELCADETPMVRRAAAKHLGTALLHSGWAHRDFGATQVTALAHDEQDSVRLLAVAALAQAGPSYGEHPTWTVQNWLPVLKDGSTDMSWYV